MNFMEAAERNFQRQLAGNSYPGRGLVIGRAAQDAWVQIYWIMGRSANSQNRRFVTENVILRTEPIDASKVSNPELIIYAAMLELPGIYLVSNGDQTQTIADALATGGSFDEALCTREREPDAPHYTPRISGMLSTLDDACPLALSILKANQVDPEQTDRFTYRPAAPPAGFGYGLTTYMGDGNPLPSFSGEPLLLPCQGDAEQILQTYWQALDENNRVALAVKWIEEDRSRIVVKNRQS